jgi:hypothetical protein
MYSFVCEKTVPNVLGFVWGTVGWTQHSSPAGCFLKTVLKYSKIFSENSAEVQQNIFGKQC